MTVEQFFLYLGLGFLALFVFFGIAEWWEQRRRDRFMRFYYEGEWELAVAKSQRRLERLERRLTADPRDWMPETPAWNWPTTPTYFEQWDAQEKKTSASGATGNGSSGPVNVDHDALTVVQPKTLSWITATEK
jgi:hypothetical protein